MSCDTKTYEEISDVKPITETVTYNKNVKAIMDNNCVFVIPQQVLIPISL
jgi:hypothetical protein